MMDCLLDGLMDTLKLLPYLLALTPVFFKLITKFRAASPQASWGTFCP